MWGYRPYGKNVTTSISLKRRIHNRAMSTNHKLCTQTTLESAHFTSGNFKQKLKWMTTAQVRMENVETDEREKQKESGQTLEINRFIEVGFLNFFNRFVPKTGKLTDENQKQKGKQPGFDPRTKKSK